jgi:chemotaxis protein methyltransferase CheR
MSLELTEREHRLFSEWLGEEFGLHFGPEKRDILRSRLEPRRAELGLDSFEQLYFHLKFHPERKVECERLIPHLTNNESYFFRESAQLEVLTDEIFETVKERATREGRKEIRILSAACASGEEPYTLAMLASDSGLFPAPWVVKVTGVDLDPQALERARAARYTANAFRRVDESIRERHFSTCEDGSWALSPGIRKMVEFRRANLVDEDWARSLPGQDIVFCRNVLIYFAEESMRRAVEGLYRALLPGGYLFLGHAESLSRIPTRLEPQRRPGAIFYRRPERDG